MSTQKMLPGNELAVWSLTDPQTPVRVGTASLALGGRGVAWRLSTSVVGWQTATRYRAICRCNALY